MFVFCTKIALTLTLAKISPQSDSPPPSQKCLFTAIPLFSCLHFGLEEMQQLTQTKEHCLLSSLSPSRHYIILNPKLPTYHQQLSSKWILSPLILQSLDQDSHPLTPEVGSKH